MIVRAVEYLVDVSHPLLFLGGRGSVDREGLPPGADQPAVLELTVVLQGLQLDILVVKTWGHQTSSNVGSFLPPVG